MNRREFLGRAAAARHRSRRRQNTLFAIQRRGAGAEARRPSEARPRRRLPPPTRRTRQRRCRSSCSCVGRNWGDMLVESHPTTGAPVPALAESWEPSADAATWTFTIRKGVKFHDGKELTIDDVIKTLQRHTDEKSEVRRARRDEIDQGNQGRRRQAGPDADGGQCGPAAAAAPTITSSSSRTAASDDPDADDRHRPLQGGELRGRAYAPPSKGTPTTGAPTAAMSIRSN